MDLQPFIVFPISDEAGYDGYGLAYAVVNDRKVTALRYLRDCTAHDDADHEFGPDTDEMRDCFNLYAGSEPVRAVMKELTQLNGQIMAGMASSWEFIAIA